MAMDQDRRDAIAWAKEWQIRQKNRRLLYCLIGIAAVLVISWLIRFVVIQTERSTFGSEEEMRAAMQGRYVTKYDYEDILIEGDTLTITFMERSHYDLEYAERYGYSEDFGDNSYEHHVTRWDYRHGVIKLDWGDDIVVDKNGDFRYDKYTTYTKTDEPRPEPLDPSILKKPAGEEETDDSELTPEEERMLEEQEDSQERQEEEDEGAEEAEEEGINAFVDLKD